MNAPATIVLGTRGSPLALAQAELARAELARVFPGAEIRIRKFTTQGDRRLEWSLEKTGGKGLFTSELEEALLAGEIDLAVHSGKDLPTETRAGLALAGCLKRARANDVLVVREGVSVPERVATGSPRRRAQAAKIFPEAAFSELRGNVSTRLRKIADGEADATFLAAAGLARLGVSAFPGLIFREMPLELIVPAAAQAAIALQCREADAAKFAAAGDAETTHAVNVERAFLSALGEGCHTAFAAHFDGGRILLFREDVGFVARRTAFPREPGALARRVSQILSEIFSA